MAVRDIVQAAAGNVGNPNAWDTTKAYYDAGSDAWNISNTYFNSITKTVAAQETAPQGVFFRADGAKMYIVGSNFDRVNEYSLSIPWDVRSIAHIRFFSISTDQAVATDIFFKPDGTKFFVTGTSPNNIREYNLSTAWDISTASVGVSFVTGNNPEGVHFRDDGLKMYILSSTTDDVVEYNLSTAWDISTASYVQNFSVAVKDTSPRHLTFSPDGTIMYFGGTSSHSLHQYSLSTAWDISTATFVQSYNYSARTTNGLGFFFKPDGSTYYIADITSDIIIQLTVGGFNLQPYISGGSSNVFFDPDGTKMYQVSLNNSRLNEFTLSTPWDISTATFVQFKTVVIVDTDADAYNAYGVFFKPDGTKFYLAGQNLGGSTDFIWEWSMSVPWDVSTATFVYRRNIEPQAQTVRALSFSDDGTKVYFVSPGASDVVVQFSLGSPWSTSAAGWVYDSSFSVASQEADPAGIFFKPDGTKMFITGTINDDVKEYTLSTPWDVSTASFLQTGVSMQTELPFPRGLFFKPDGTQFWTVGFPSSNIRVLSYSISPI